MPAKKAPVKMHMMPDGSMMKGKMTKAQMATAMRSKGKKKDTR